MNKRTLYQPYTCNCGVSLKYLIDQYDHRDHISNNTKKADSIQPLEVEYDRSKTKSMETRIYNLEEKINEILERLNKENK